MLKDITLGQFYPVDSFVHRLDPRVKIILTFAFIVGVFLGGGLLAYLPVVAFIYVAAKAAHLPLKMLAKGIKPLRFILIFTFVLNLFFNGGDTLTTSPVVLTDGLERLLSPLRKIGFPAHELAMMMTIALRFIPTLLEEADKIMKAQMARGADFESGNLLQRAKAMIPLLVPLFVSAFRRAGDLAMAMESRCYHGSEGRTRMRVLKVTKNDLIAAAVVALMIALTCVM